MLVAIVASAQFHVETGINFNNPTGDFGEVYDIGIGVYVEPKYAINENIDLGLMIASNGFAGASVQGASIDGLRMLNIMPTGTYRFSENKVTPYAGLGLGIYSYKIDSFDLVNGSTEETQTEFGFAPRAGVYIGRLNLGTSYNIVKDTNFLQFTIGARILSRD